MSYTILSWNVNGIRAVGRKGFTDWIKKTDPYIMCVQETKAQKEQLRDDLLNVKGYYSYWDSAEKKGYSGVACYVKEKPVNVEYGIGDKVFDKEGRCLLLEYNKFTLLNIYFPNGNMSGERLKFKLDFYDFFLKKIKKLIKENKTVIVCGDINTAHKEIDLARPNENSGHSGFLPEEREWLDKFIKAGLVDTFREYHKGPGHYSWWDFKTRARERNVGWRIDYFYINAGSLSILKDAFILNEVEGSDHCPIGIKIAV